MSEFEILKNMFDREGVNYTIDKETEYDEETETEIPLLFLCVPAFEDEFLILGFNQDGELSFVDASTDWEGYLERRAKS